MRNLSFAEEFYLHFSRLGPFGCSPKAPGTVGSAFSLVIAPLFFMPLDFMQRLLLLGIIFIVGSIAASNAEKILGKKDPGEVVVDELLGQWLTLLPFATLDWGWMLVGFALFRLFDIWKPWPVKAAEHWLPSGWGVMIDDAVAGVYAMIVLGLLRFAV